MGAVGGLLGALFNSLNINLSKYRMRFLHRRGRIWKYVWWTLKIICSLSCAINIYIYRVFEAVLIVMVTTASIFIAATFLGTCIRENASANSFLNECPEIVNHILKDALCYSYIHYRVMLHSGMKQGPTFVHVLEQSPTTMTWLPWCSIPKKLLSSSCFTRMVRQPATIWILMLTKTSFSYITVCRCLYFSYTLHYVSHLFLHCLLDVRSWYSQWSVHPKSFDWCSLWTICGHCFWVGLNFNYSRITLVWY